jgi:hypothetical protein
MHGVTTDLTEYFVLSTEHEMISARNAIDAHAQTFDLNELLLHIMKTFAQSTCSLHANELLRFSLCALVEVSVARAYRSAVLPPYSQ